jgi:hypothetical protein
MKKVLAAFLVATLILSISGLAFEGASSMTSKAEDGDIEKAVEEAEEKLLQLEGIAGISHTKDKIIVYIEHEKHKDKVPKEVKGFKNWAQ